MAIGSEAPAQVSRRLEWLLVGAALLVGVLDTAQWQLGAELRGDPVPFLNAVGTQFLPWVWLAILMPAVAWLAFRRPLDGERWRTSLGPHLAGMIVFALFHIAGTILLIGGFARQPVDWSLISTKSLLFRFPIDAMAYWAAVGAAHAARATALAREREQAAVRLEASLAETRLAALRDRLNPHFFFNTLNAVSTLALRRDHDGVIRTVEAMGDLLRVTLDDRKGQEAPLAAELAFLDRYLEIEQLRFGDRLTFDRRIDRTLLDALVPVMIVQPLVENAVLHGAAVKPGPVRIEISARREDRDVILEVADTGPGFGGAAKGNGAGIGLANCRARLKGLYGDRGTLVSADAPSGGAVVRVRIPYRPAGTGEVG